MAQGTARFILLTALALAWTLPVRAQAPGNCAQGTAENTLHASDVRAVLFNTGSLFYGNTTTAGNGYFVPIATEHSPIFAEGIWVGGKVNGQLRVAGATYDDFEFWPGPLLPGGTLPDPNDCTPYDRIWVVSAADVRLYDETGWAAPDLAEWPAHLGAEVADGDGVPGNYNLPGGDRPRLFGNQTAFWVMNDVGNDHENSNTLPMGLEVQVTAFAVSTTEEALDLATFYRYRLVNRSPNTLDSLYVGFFDDDDLGDAADDLIGADTLRDFGLTYNAANTDAVYGIPPAVGQQIVQGPVGLPNGLDDDGDGTVDEPGERLRLSSHSYFVSAAGPMSDPVNGLEMYRFLQGRWKDGTPMTVGGNGYQTGGPPTKFAYPGDPVTRRFWSEECPNNPCGPSNAGSDRRHVSTTGPFRLAPGTTDDIVFAIPFGWGANRLDSITRLRAAADTIRARFDRGTLLAPHPVTLLPTPAPLSPPDSALFVGTPPWLTWTPVAGARHYAVRLSTGAVLTTDSTSVQARNLPVNEVHTISWTVQAFGVGAQSLPSAPRTFIYYRYEAEWAGGGAGIMETAHPVQPPCPDPGDPGCDAFGGNTVWHDENVSDDYYLTAFDGTGFEAGSIQRIAPFFEAAAPDDYEVRFTANGGLAVYVFATAGNNRVARVPFELWNVGDPADPADDVRMIPALLLPAGQSYLTDWTNQFPGTDPWTAGPRSRITQPVYFFMPDRPDGYARFEQDALAFGGAGAVYHPNADGDTQVDINPATGQPCPNQHYYVNFCYEGAGNRVYTIGRLAFADLANDGTTPPPGTIIRFAITDPEIVGNEPEPGGAPLAFVLGAPYPNPFNPRAVVPFELSEPGAVRLTVVDVLGREVAMLANGLLPAGRHTATLDGARLASGVYVVVLDAGGQRHTRKVLLVK